MTHASSAVAAGFAGLTLVLAVVAPGLSGLLLEVTVLALIGLSLEVVVRRLGAPVLTQPAVVAAAAWVTAALLGRNQSPVVALAAAVLAGVAIGLAPLPAHRGGRVALGVAGIGTALLVTALVPPAPGFRPPVFLGVGLGTPRAALVLALVVLAVGVWLREATLEADLGRWLALVRDAPGLVARVGVSAPAVVGAGLALSGALAGLAGWAAAIGTLGAPSMRAIDPAIGLAWLLIPLAGGAGAAGAVTGAAVFTGVARLAAGAGVPTLALAAPLVAVLLWRRAAR